MKPRQDLAEPTLLASLVRHYDELVEYVRCRFGHREFAHDVIHDVGLRLLERPEPPPARQPLALLRRISRDMAIDHRRSEGAYQRRVMVMHEVPDAACEAAAPDSAFQSEQELQRLIAAVRKLPLRRRQVFVLHKIHELSQAEVAKRMQISVKMVEKHARLGLASCRAALAAEARND